MDQSILRLFGHVERIKDDRLAKKVHESVMQGPRYRGRPCKGWMDGVKQVLSKKGPNFPGSDRMCTR